MMEKAIDMYIYLTMVFCAFCLIGAIVTPWINKKINDDDER